MDLDIFHHHKADEVPPVSTTPASPVAAGQNVPAIAHLAANDIQNGIRKFISVLDMIGEKVEEGLAFAVKYEVPAEQIVTLFFPAVAPEAAGAVAAINLIQHIVMLVKQKSAALPASPTSDQMLAEEMAVLAPVVIQLLAKEGVKIDEAQVEKDIKLAIAILNAQPATA
jgi:hypothetical protein